MKKIMISQLADRLRLSGRIVPSPIGPQPFVCLVIGNPDGEDVRLDFASDDFLRFVEHCNHFVGEVKAGRARFAPEPD